MHTVDGSSTPADGWQTGMNLLSQGKASEAITALQSFLKTHPDSFEGHNYLGVALGHTGRHNEAIASLQRATELHPQSAATRFNLGVVYEKMGRVEAARKEYQSAAQLDPKHNGARIALARVGSSIESAPLPTPTAVPSPPLVNENAPPQLSTTQIAERERAARPNILNLMGGFAAGVIAAVICAVLWDKLTYYTGWQFGYAAIGVGLAVGTSVVYGAGKKHGISLQIISALLSLGGILLGETLLVMDYVRDEIAKNPSPETAGVTALRIFFVSIFLLPESFKESPMSVLFALIGLWFGWSAPAKPAEGEFPEATAMDAPAPVSAVSAGIIDAPPATTTPLPDAPNDAPPRA